MRAYTASGLAAAKSLKAKPAISAAIADKRLRWQSLHWDDGSSQPTDMAILATTIWRVRSDTSGNVQTAKITNPTTKAQWTTWTTRVASALPSGDVAIAVTGTQLRIVYVTGTYTVATITSDDSGDSWSAAENIVTGLPAAPYVATINSAVFVFTAGDLRCYTKSGTWELRATWATGATTMRGCDAEYTSSYYRTIVAYDGKVLTRSLNPSTWTWATALQIAPGGTGTPPGSSQLQHPAVCWTGTYYMYSWTDLMAGTPGWEQPVVHTSNIWGYIGNEVALTIWGTTPRRTAMAFRSSDSAIFAANEKCICYAHEYAAKANQQYLSGLTVLSYSRRTREQESRIELDTLNDQGQYNSLGQPTAYGQSPAYAACIKPLAQILLTRGYVTSAGTETITLDPHYIISAELTAAKGRGTLTLTAVDAWGLLDLWRAAEPMTWANQTIQWLLNMICHRVGLSWSDNGDAAFTQTLNIFTITPGMNAADAVRELLRLAGGAAWPDADGNLYGVNLYGYGPLNYVEIGPAEILRARYTLAANYATSPRVFGTGVAAAAELSSESMYLGLRITRSYDDYRVTTSTIANNMQRYLWTRARISDREEEVTIPMRPDPELWDICQITDPEGIIPATSKLRNISGIDEDYDSRRGTLTTTLHLLDA